MSKNVKFKIFNFTFWDILNKTPTDTFLLISLVIGVTFLKS